MQDPAPGRDPQRSHRPHTPDSISTPYPSPSCRPLGSEGGGSCGTWERQREASLLLPVVSVTLGHVPRDGQLLVVDKACPSGLVLLLSSMWLHSVDSCQLAGQWPNPARPPPVLCWNLKLLILSLTQSREASGARQGGPGDFALCIRPKLLPLGLLKMALTEAPGPASGYLLCTDSPSRLPSFCPSSAPTKYPAPSAGAHMILRGHWGWPQPQGW